MIIELNEYRQKVLGCWMGKNIGGTLGAPFEWRRQINDVSFYIQDLDGNPLPNDDLDIQLLWLIAMEEKGIDIDAKLLAEYWMLYVTPHWAEYGTAKINMKSGLMPPLCGIFNNDYKDSCGSFIRSEIWACIAPGCPEIAAKFAYEDAIIDHGNGEGVYAEVFCAALESAAFVEKDISKLIEIGLSYIPEDCGVAKAIRNATDSYKSGMDWKEARDEMLAKYRGRIALVSKEDREKGFADGQRGWDAPSNIGMLIIGLLYGEGDFEKSICITVNCGEDTDCTAATYGSIYGIINGIDAIPEKWKKPIGRKIITACINLGELTINPGFFGEQLPGDIDNLTERVEKIAQQVIQRYNLPIEISMDKKTDLSDLKDEMLFAGQKSKLINKNLNGPVYRFDFFNVMVDYGGDPTIKDNTSRTIKLKIENIYKVQELVNIHWYTPDNWKVSPSGDGKVFVVPASWVPDNKGNENNIKEIEFKLETEKVDRNINRCVIELTLEGKHTVMLVPIVLLNGNYK